jgi:uncharacterized glyoxalase superfamily protein PhnB
VLVPYLTFRDGSRSLTFLTEALGFTVVAEQRGDDGGVVHAELQRGDDVVMAGDGDAAPGTAPGLYLVAETAEEVDAVAERVAAAGGDLFQPPADHDWGSRRARFRDLDGHEWTIGTYRPGTGW